MTAKDRECVDSLLAQSIPEPNSGCWLWTGTTDRAGYGSVRYNYRRWAAHRAAWTIWRGSIPEGMVILHKCDTPECINPDHLRVGTIAENNADKIAKGRGRGGPNQPKRIPSHLSPEEWEQFRARRIVLSVFKRAFGDWAYNLVGHDVIAAASRKANRA